MANKLNKKQSMFVKEYLIDLNATQAAIRAGYSKKTANFIACENLTKPNIQEAIQKALKKRNEKLDIDAGYVLKRLIDFDTLNIKDILNDNGDIKPISEWPDVWCTSISGLDISAISSKEDINTVLKKIKWPDKVKNLELIGKHINVRAWDKDDNNDDEALPLHLHFDVKDAVKDIKVTRGES